MEVNQTIPVAQVGQGGGQGSQTGTSGGKNDQQEEQKDHSPHAHDEPAINIGGLLGLEDLSPEVQHAFEKLAAEVEPLRRQVARLEEELTQALELEYAHSILPTLNRRGFLVSLEKLLGRLGQTESRPALILLNLTNAEEIRRTLGRAVLDDALRRVLDVLNDDGVQAMIVGNVGGNDFALVVLESGLDAVRTRADQLAATLRAVHIAGDTALQTRIGIAVLGPGMTPEAALAAADRDLL